MKLRVSLFVVVAALMICVAPALAESAKGKITKVDAAQKTFAMQTADGKSLTFTCGDQSKVRLNNKDAQLSDLKEGQEVTVTYDVQGGKNVATAITGGAQ